MGATMHRRLALAALACCPAAPLRARDSAPPRPRQKVSAGQLFEALDARFPVRFGLEGLLAVEVSAPRLLLLPARNRIGATLAVQVEGLQLPAAAQGEMDLVFALRYEAADRTVRARDPRLLDLRWPGLAPDAAAAVRNLLPALARQLGEVVLHRFTPRELALPDTMGFEPDRLEVVDDGLIVFFGPKPPR